MWQDEHAVLAMPPVKSAAWQDVQVLKPLDALADAPCCVGASHPAGCPGTAWQSVLLKQPGVVPAGAGVTGTMEEFAPLAWHWAQMGALPWFVFVWVYVPPLQGARAWGAFTPWQEKQDIAEIPPEKSVAWHSWQIAKPLDWAFAEAPCESGKFHVPVWRPVDRSNDAESLELGELHPAKITSSATSKNPQFKRLFSIMVYLAVIYNDDTLVLSTGVCTVLGASTMPCRLSSK